jgi:hypothetical protein
MTFYTVTTKEIIGDYITFNYSITILNYTHAYIEGKCLPLFRSNYPPL